jgi:hypothetical protein
MDDYRKKITNQEHNLLLQFPAFVSLLAANTDGVLDQEEKDSARELAHTKTFSCDPLLRNFYKEVDRSFEHTLEDLDKSLPMEKESRATAIKVQLLNIENIMLKLGDEYTSVMHRSMKSFKDHVSQAHHNVLIDFLFPIPIKGLSY